MFIFYYHFPDHKILCLGLIQSLFEGSMYTFVLEWTPALSSSQPDPTRKDHIPHGYIFAGFMVCRKQGGRLNWGGKIGGSRKEGEGERGMKGGRVGRGEIRLHVHTYPGVDSHPPLFPKISHSSWVHFCQNHGRSWPGFVNDVLVFHWKSSPVTALETISATTWLTKMVHLSTSDKMNEILFKFQPLLQI